MIITFCGHAQFRATEQCERKLLTFLETHVGDSPAQMYLGGYGEFDSFVLRCCRKYRETHPQIKLVLVSPYLSDSYQRNHLCDSESRYDEILYPAIEDKPLRFAIVYRNQYMVQQVGAAHTGPTATPCKRANRFLHSQRASCPSLSGFQKTDRAHRLCRFFS